MNSKEKKHLTSRARAKRKLYKQRATAESKTFRIFQTTLSIKKHTEQPSATAISTLSTRQHKLNRRHITAMKHQETEHLAWRHERNNHKDTKL
jgi:hypothetical protein